MKARADHSSPPMRTRPPVWSTRASTTACAPSSAAAPGRSAAGVVKRGAARGKRGGVEIWPTAKSNAAIAQASHAAIGQSLWPGNNLAECRHLIGDRTRPGGGDDEDRR